VIPKAQPKPFPWGCLDSTTRVEVEVRRAMGRWMVAHTRIDRVEAALSDLVDARVEILPGRVWPAAQTCGLADGVGVLIGRADSSDPARAALVACERALAAVLVARALRRPIPRLLETGSAVAPSGAIAGALAAVLFAAARRAHASIALRVLAAGPAAALEGELTRADPVLATLSATILVADDAFAACLLVPHGAVAAAPPPTCTAPSIAAALGPAPLSLPIVACARPATASDLARLRIGDVWLPGGWPLARGAGGMLEGPVLLAAPSSDLGMRARLAPDGRLVLGGEMEALYMQEADVSETVEEGALLQAIGEVPVVVRVEVGEARMAAREWANLERGDVIALGRRIGERVILRVGGVPVARGDLVEIDGEVGVRIVERTTGAPEAP
jgi:flagellar motor switch/type III secretory pathway protein FliN